MKILIISDTHGNIKNLRKVIEMIGKIDALLHLGDVEGGESAIVNLVNCTVEFVAGNNDYYSGQPREKIIDINGYKIFMCHGDNYYVGYSTNKLRDAAEDKKVNLVLYGHTHRPHLDQSGDITILNPGSISYPRQEGRQPSYAVLELDNKGVPHFSINFLKYF